MFKTWDHILTLALLAVSSVDGIERRHEGRGVGLSFIKKGEGELRGRQCVINEKPQNMSSLLGIPKYLGK